MRGSDSPLAEAIVKAVSWVAAQPNQGEAHFADTDAALSDAWMVVSCGRGTHCVARGSGS